MRGANFLIGYVGSLPLKKITAYSATKMLLNGHVQKRIVSCGKSNCRCARGEKHWAYYHCWSKDGRRYQNYIRRGMLNQYIEACAANRELRAQLRRGLIQYKRALAVTGLSYPEVLVARGRNIAKGD
jgi:N-glycosylase/DNA lyase